ncbi:uncharacterized protein EV420DRAFT_1751541 [Desarmillaria tabescens]|uniref:NADH:flavin oxidoreductase/NADH oxidase N-terminal domain-containing protein n=1 Tax=Armillaria tabescens TaxID=1929756 RepID=A0AA39JS77_ARMTA|nr:uncharacterized protein EV420DRAFT_1751541 [Desarmillaria tabescens]KAK0445618.1 hypothetical protein EV420DRAFT_1751541 [Desarmillaria tabescens]
MSFNDLLSLSQNTTSSVQRPPEQLLISEGTVIAPKASGYSGAPKIWSDEQIAAWKEGSYIYMQIAAVGREASPDALRSRDPAIPHVGASALPPTPDAPVPRAMTKEEIMEYIGFFGIATANAVHKARFDGIEIHGANGVLVDEYGGSMENRMMFPL